MTMTRILVPTDFSLDADAGLAYGLALAKAVAASVHLLHVVEMPVGPWSSDIYSPEMAGLQVNLVRDAEEQLRRGIKALDRPGVTITADARAGRAVPSIVEFARDKGIDLIVLGSHGRTGLSHLMMGSVAERVVRTAPCPVLVVRPVTRDTHPDTAAKRLEQAAT